MKKKYRLVFFILSVISALCIYIVSSNYDFIFGNVESQEFNIEDLELENWDRTDGLISLEDAQIIIDNLNRNVSYVDLYGVIQEIKLNPKVYFTDKENNSFNEEYVIDSFTRVDEGCIRFEFSKYIGDLRIDLTEEPGMILELDRIVVYPGALHINYVHLSTVAFVSVIVFYLLYFGTAKLKEVAIYFQALKKYSYLLMNLVKKDITTKYRRSILGILWSILNPLFMMLVITAVFRKIFSFSVENFPLYYLTGALIFNFSSEATSTAMTSILGASSLIRKVYIPKYIFPLQKCLFAMINMLFSMIAILIIFIILKVIPPLTIVLFPIPMLYAFVFCVGLGMILCTVNVFFRDTGHLYAVWLTAWMYLTPIIYPIDILPKAMLTFIKLNPLYYYVEYFRDVVLYGTVPGLELNLVCILFSMVTFGLGLIVFKHKQDDFILYI